MISETITIDGHTFIPGLMTHGGYVIDAGCRGFKFARLCEDLNRSKVYALDIENFEGDNQAWKFKHAGLSAKPGFTDAYYFGNGTGNFLKGLHGEPGNLPERPCETKPVQLITLDEIYQEIGTDIDLLKLDIEMSEYEILVDLKPIPKQISVEFHEHVNKELHDKYIDKIMDHLGQYYHCNLYIREWPRYKFMDCLFIRKDLI